MSWNVSRIGHAGKIAGMLAMDFERNKCAEPEESIKNAVAKIVADALAAGHPSAPVKIEASGSQSSNPDGSSLHTLSVKIEQLWRFVE